MEHIEKNLPCHPPNPYKTSNLASPSQTPHPPRQSLHPSNLAQQYVDIPRSKPPSSVGPNPQEAGAPSLPRLPDLRTSPPKKCVANYRTQFCCDVCLSMFFYFLDVVCKKRGIQMGQQHMWLLCCFFPFKRNEKKTKGPTVLLHVPVFLLYILFLYKDVRWNNTNHNRTCGDIIHRFMIYNR